MRELKSALTHIVQPGLALADLDEICHRTFGSPVHELGEILRELPK